MHSSRFGPAFGAGLLLLWGALLIAPRMAHAQTTYHVAPGGNDGNDGSAAAPWATLQHAADTVQPGDSVLVYDGTYTGFQIDTSGSAAQPIVFKAAGSNAVVNAVNPVRGQDNINVEGADYVVIEGFRVRDADRAGIRVVIARGVVVKHNTVGPNGKWGIFTGFARAVQILDNETFGSDDEHGIYVSNSDVAADDPVIRGNVSYDNNANGIQLNGDCFAGGDGVIGGALIEDNVVYGNGFKGFSLISIDAAVVRNNVIYDNGLNGGAGGIHLVDEPGCGLPTVDTDVVNNTIVEPRIAGIRINDGATNNVIFNNLIVSSQPIRDEVGGNHIDPASNLTAGATTGLFVDPATGDYHLAAGSPAIDAGVAAYEGVGAPANDHDGAARPQGGGWDAGAYERAAYAFTLTLKKLIRTATGVKKAKLKWTAAAIPSGKLDFYIDRAPDGSPDKRTRNDGAFKLKITLPGDGPFTIQACQKKSTSFCSNTVVADFTGVPIDLNEPDDEDRWTSKSAAGIPEAFALRGTYPNPFRDTATIRFDLPEAAQVRLAVYDVLGRQVLSMPPQRMEAGQGHLRVAAVGLAAGTYLYRLTVRRPGQTDTATGRLVRAR